MKTSNSFELLELRSCLERSEANTLPLNWVPFVNVLVIGLGLFLLSSKWLCPPGLQLFLPKVSTLEMAYQTSLPLMDVLILDQNMRIFYNRKLYNFDQIKQLFKNADIKQGLVLQIDKSIALEYVLILMEQAHACGYKTVQIAVNAL